MKQKSGYLALTVAWIVGLVIGGGVGFLAVRNVKGDPNAGLGNLGLVFLLIALVILSALVGGFITCALVLLFGDYTHVAKTILIMLFLLITVVALTSVLLIPGILLPFVPVVARYIALRTAPKVPLEVSLSPAAPTK